MHTHSPTHAPTRARTHLTQEEALQVTGFTDEAAAAQAILSRPRAATEWCVVKMGGEGALLMTKAGEVHHAPALQVRLR
jgi:sugar/nucleoside kinase (ribokinase family)